MNANPRRRGLLLGIGGAAVAATAATAVTAAVAAGPSRADHGPTVPPTAGTSLATVRQGSLSAQVDATGTLSFAARDDGTPFSAVNQATGIYTWLPDTGSTVACGEPLYRVAGRPVLLLCGTTPAHRDLRVGRTGRDVRALNRNLRTLGFADKDEIGMDQDTFDHETAEAVRTLQDDANVSETGALPLGSIVFLPGPVRVSQVAVRLGTRARPDQQVLAATSDDRLVTVDLNAAQQVEVEVGDAVRITLPDRRTTPGRVVRVGTVASSTGDDGSASSTSSSTVPIHVRLRHPEAAGRLDRAPVRVQITTDGVKEALAVPVVALVGTAGGGYAVERVDAAGRRAPVPVTLGLFSDADGLVQVSGDLAPGDRVVVPAP